MRRQRISHSNAQRRQPRWKRLEAAVAGVFMLVQLLGALHFAIVHHVVCLEHGEVSHPPEIEGLSDWLVSGSNDSAPGVNAPVAGWNKSGTEHQHCLVQALRRDSATRMRVNAPVALEPARERDIELRISHKSEDSALFRLAPKHSPPA